LTGAAAFPRPAAGPASAAGAAPSASETIAQPDATPAPAPATGGASSGEAGVGSRPSLGAVRKKAAATKAAPEAASVPTGNDPASSAGPQPGAADAPAQGGEVVDRDSLTEAWGDSILRALPARAKALFSAGRFVSVDEKGAHFALPNAAHRDRCAEMVGTVEQKLSAHFGTPVTLILDVDDSAHPGSGAGAAPVRSSEPPSARSVGPAAEAGTDDDPSEYADYAEAAAAADADAGEQALEAEARLLQAFPGASEVGG